MPPFKSIQSISQKSPSSRRAWIEIPQELCQKAINRVALLAEGVDRNNLIGS